MPAIPHDRFDSTLALAREGYRMISNACDRHGSDIIRTRLMLHRVVCMRGAEAARMFYSEDRFTRVGAMPRTVLRLLQDYGSVQMLDDALHRHRKAMFLAIGSQGMAAQLAQQFGHAWKKALTDWHAAGDVVLLHELRALLTRAGAAWAAVPMTERDVSLRTREFSEMLESTGSVGPRNWRAQVLRERCERWARRVIVNARSADTAAPAGSVLDVVATHRDLDGRLLDTKVAAVELLNVLRAIVAVARFIVFAALALHEHPEWRRRVLDSDASVDSFVLEVRRITPFFAFIGGRARESFTWRGYRFAEGDWALLDLYGTNMHPGIWRDPDIFRPERFRERQPTPFELVPQGAGNRAATHRCPGEGMTAELMKTAIRLLARMHYAVPAQDLNVDLARIPAIPASGFTIRVQSPALVDAISA